MATHQFQGTRSDKRRSMEFRGVPTDVQLIVKRRVLEYNVEHVEDRIGQTDVLTAAVRFWEKMGGDLGETPHHPDPESPGPARGV